MNVETLVDQAREKLGGGVVEQVNRLAVDYNPGDQAITLQYPPQGVAQGVPLCVGLNTMMVWAVNTATREVDVTPGWAGSPVGTAPTGTIVRVRPIHHTHRIFDGINDVINELSAPTSGIYGVGTILFDYDQTIDTYDLIDAENLSGVLSVQIGDPDDPTDRWVTLSNVTDYELRSTAPTDQAPSGRELRIHGPLGVGNTLRVTYKSTLQQFDSLGDDVSMSGLPETAYDLPVWGVAAALAIPMEQRRNLPTSQPDTRRAAEVPPGASAAAARLLAQKYQQRVDQEAARLIAAYPYRVG